MLVTAQVGFFAARFAPHLLGRDLAALPPLLFVIFALWLSRRPTRSAVQVLAAFAVLALVVAAPWNTLVGANALPDSFGIAILSRWHQTTPENLVLIGALIALGLFAGAFRRVWLLLPTLALGLLIAASTVAAGDIETQANATQANIVGSPANWIDRATASPVTYVYNGEIYWNTVWEERFWNTRIDDLLTLWPSAVPGPIPQTQVTVPVTGLLPTTNHYIVASDQSTCSSSTRYAGRAHRRDRARRGGVDALAARRPGSTVTRDEQYPAERRHDGSRLGNGLRLVGAATSI